MISKSLQNLVLIAVVVLIIHGIEEYVTGFYVVDKVFLFLIAPLVNMSVPQAAFLVFQVMLWILLVVSMLLLRGQAWIFRLLAVLGVILVLEAEHLLIALAIWSYYPGSFTALAFPVLSFLYWKQLLIEWKKQETS